MFSMTTLLDLILGFMSFGPGALQKQTPKQSFFTGLYFLALVTCVAIFILYLGLDWKPARMEILGLNSEFCVFQKSDSSQEKSRPDTKPFLMLISCDNRPYTEKLIRLGLPKSQSYNMVHAFGLQMRRMAMRKFSVCQAIFPNKIFAPVIPLTLCIESIRSLHGYRCNTHKE
jgi:hypothetical protein